MKHADHANRQVHRHLLSAALAAALLLLTGCGGGGDDEDDAKVVKAPGGDAAYPACAASQPTCL